jgi:hypothetical protein
MSWSKRAGLGRRARHEKIVPRAREKVFANNLVVLFLHYGKPSAV